MTVTAPPITTRSASQRRFFLASTCASMFVFAALATMLVSMTSAHHPLPAEDLLHLGADRTASLVTGVNAH